MAKQFLRLKQNPSFPLSFILILLLFILVLTMTACAQENKYKLDLAGQDDLYTGAKEYYKAGEQVTVYYKYIATDTDYSFYLDDGSDITFSYDYDKGIKLQFIMADHDMTLTVDARNTMEHIPPDPAENILLIDYYQATQAAAEDSGYYEITVSRDYDDTWLYLHEYTKENAAAEEQCRVYYVPGEIAAECLTAAEEYDMLRWNELEQGYPLDGALIVCKFLAEDRLIRVSSEYMPQNGRAAFDKILGILKSYMLDEYLI